MPTFRQDEKLGTKVPLIKTADFNDKSVTAEKLAEGSVTNSKLAPESVTQDKFDKELLHIFKAAAGLPENLIETIQNVDTTLADHQRQISSNDDDISDLQTKTKQIKDTVDGIAISGGASVGSAVTYDNTQSGLDAQNIQNAIDELVNNLGHYETNEEWLRAYTDADNKFLWGIRVDGSIDWAVGIPKPIQKALNEIIANSKTFQQTLTEAMDAYKATIDEKVAAIDEKKVDKEEGKSLVEDEVKECFKVIENDEFIKAITDTDDRILFGFRRDTGKPYYPLNEMYHVEQNEEFFALWLDAADHVLLGLRRDGQIIGEIHAVNALKQVISQLQSDVVSLQEKVGTIDINLKELLDVFSLQDNPEFVSVKKDADGKLIEGLRKDGTRVVSKLESESIPTKKDIISTVVESSELSNKIADLLGNGGDILSLYPIRSEKPILANFKYHTVESGTYIKPNFTLLYFADLHSVSRRLGRIMEYYNQYKEYLDDIVSVGDANHSFDENFSFWKENGASCVLNALGNHEVFGRSRAYKLSEEDKQNNIVKKYTTDYNVPTYSSKECYDKFIKPYLLETKINSVENKCYFYKDYESAKIRIIALDVYHWKDIINCKKEYADGHTESYTSETFPNGDMIDKGEQAEWFKSILEDSRQKGFNVICMIHAPKIDTHIDCTFTNLDRPISSYNGTSKDKEYSDLVEAFMADHDDEYGAGKFICWLCGHSHSDAIGIYSSYPKQLKIVIDTAGCLRQPSLPQFDFTGDFDRIEETYSDDLFDIFAVDTEHKYISLHRVGCHSDSHGRHIGNLVYDYKNMKLLYNN